MRVPVAPERRRTLRATPLSTPPTRTSGVPSPSTSPTERTSLPNGSVVPLTLYIHRELPVLPDSARIQMAPDAQFVPLVTRSGIPSPSTSPSASTPSPTVHAPLYFDLSK